uniref:Uncharacterized protein n=1 Tax=Arundo donax TaxID=35708 RepID=A0A0A9C7T6_ARUDO
MEKHMPAKNANPTPSNLLEPITLIDRLFSTCSMNAAVPGFD